MWKKKRLYLMPVTIILLIAVVTLGACAKEAAAPAQVIKLTMANYLPAAHLFTPLQEQWGKEVMARSNGRVEITYFPAGSLVTAAKVPDSLTTGIVDIAFSHIGYNRGRFPVTEVLDLPMGYPTGWVGSHIATDFLDKYKPAEWDGFHLVLVNAGTTAGLMLRNTKVTKLEDLKGKTLRGAGEVASAIEALGATPRDIPMGEMYDSVSKGVVDGTLVGIETLKSFKMADVCKYTAFAWQVGNMYAFYLAMNKAKWDALPKDIQKIFNDVSKEYAEKYAATWNQIDIDGINYSLSIKGNEVFTLSDAEGKRFNDAVQPVLGKYVDAMVAKGFKKSEVEGWIDYIKSRIEYWKPKEKERSIPSPFDVKLPQG
jgi:TRAP-type C4-dicarboxylate transport system substrate-binding protein